MSLIQFRCTLESAEEIYKDYNNSNDKRKEEYDAFFIKNYGGGTCWMYHFMKKKADPSYEPEFFEEFAFTPRQRKAFWDCGFQGTNNRWNSMILLNEKAPMFLRGKAEMLVVRNSSEVFLCMHGEDALSSYRIPGGSFETNKSHLAQAIAETKEEAFIVVRNARDPEISYELLDIKQPSKYKDSELTWAGKFVEVYVSDYASDFHGFIPKVDRDDNMRKNGDFYPIKDVFHLLSPYHKMALKKFYNIDSDITESTIEDVISYNESEMTLRDKAIESMENNSSIRLIYDTYGDLDALEKLYFDFNNLTSKEKLLSNDTSISIFGKNVADMYTELRTKYIEQKTHSYQSPNVELEKDPSHIDGDDNTELTPYFTPSQMQELGVFGEACENCYNVVSSKPERKAWFDQYKNSYNYAGWTKLLENALAEYTLNPCDKTKQGILECGWNPEVPYSPMIVMKRSKIISEQLRTELADSSVLNEAYFGITPAVEKMIDTLSKFRKKFFDNYKGKHTKVNSDPLWITFCNQIRDFFGFGEVQIIIDESCMINALTIPLSLRKFNAHKKVTMADHGFVYDGSKNAIFIAIIFAGILFNRNFTDREILAALFHEIGHNFSPAFNSEIALYKNYQYILSPLVIVFSIIYFIMYAMKGYFSLANTYLRCALIETYPGTKLYIALKKIEQRSKILSTIYDFKELLSANITDIMLGVEDLCPFSAIPNIILKYMKEIVYNIQNPLNFFFTFLSYKDEKYADNFATIYGLGPDIQSIQLKLERYGSPTAETMKKIPVYKYFYGFNRLLVNILSAPIDEHPDSVTRIVAQTNYLKAELNKQNLSPKIRKQIEQDLKNAEEIEKELLKVDPKDAMLLSDLYNKALYKSSAKGDFRQLFSNLLDPEQTKYNNNMDSVRRE